MFRFDLLVVVLFHDGIGLLLRKWVRRRLVLGRRDLGEKRLQFEGNVNRFLSTHEDLRIFEAALIDDASLIGEHVLFRVRENFEEGFETTPFACIRDHTR